MEVRGVRNGEALTVTVDGRDVSAAFADPGRDGITDGVVSGLQEGANQVTASSGGRSATLQVDNHPITGPVISGPHQEPFICETEQSQLGPPLDEDCSATPTVSWYSRDLLGNFHRLADPYAPYPADTATARTRDGRQVPFVVRVESRTINRSITRLGVLDDPAARGRGVPYAPTTGWNRSVVYQFGESCGTGYHQGRNTEAIVLGGEGISAENLAGLLVQPAARLGEGYMWAHSTLTIFGVHCNQVLTAETMMMVKEHITEAYGTIDQVLGVGASGGALQQYTVIDGYPGLLDAGVPIISFPDVVSTAMTTVDCGLLDRVFQADPGRWPVLERPNITGLTTDQQCQDWVDLFLPNIDPSGGCAGIIPDELRYDAATNPGGARCTVQDTAVNALGRDPGTGFARRPIDNTGVQYGLRALQRGQLSIDDFVFLNATVGGYDIDGGWQPERMSMTDDLARRVYRYGGVTGRGAPEQTPMIDIRLYVDLIPVLGFHDQVRPYIFDARLEDRGLGPSHVTWNGVPLPSDALRIAHVWADNVDQRVEAGQDRVTAVAEGAPPEAEDRCVVPAAYELVGLQLGPIPLVSIPGCSELFGLTAAGTTRQAAGGPRSEDIIKCALAPVDPADYPGISDAQLAQLRAIFPTGVCDWTQPGVGTDVETLTWVSVGGDELAAEPFTVPDVVARSTDGAAGTGAAPHSLPATGRDGRVEWLLVAAAVAAGGSSLSRGRGRRAAR